MVETQRLVDGLVLRLAPCLPGLVTFNWLLDTMPFDDLVWVVLQQNCANLRCVDVQSANAIEPASSVCIALTTIHCL